MTGPVSGIVLAGGRSRRMGQDKGALELNGKTFLDLQVEKLRVLGIEDILLSGGALPPLAGTRVIPDHYPGRGPLAGLHACLSAARNPAALVLSVDTPLVPLESLQALLNVHGSGITYLRHNGRTEPLIAVYDGFLAAEMESLLVQGDLRARALLGRVEGRAVDYAGAEELLQNCNTPEDFQRLAETFARLHHGEMQL